MKLASRPFVRLLSRIVRPVMRQRPPWMAMTLRWRLARRRSPALTMRPQRGTSHYWAPRFNLHFSGAHPTVNHPCPMPAAPLHMTPLSWRRTIARTPEKHATVRMVADRETRHSTRTTENVVRRFSTIRETQVATPLPPVRVVTPRGRQPEMPGTGIPRATIEVARDWRRDRLPVADAASAARHATSHVAAATAQVRWAGAARRELSSAEPRRESRQASAPRRAQELVWRTQERDRAAEPDMFVPPRAAAPARAQTINTVMSVASPAQVGALLRQQTLDPAIVERLTDDVINRVERRIRIERERRGL